MALGPGTCLVSSVTLSIPYDTEMHLTFIQWAAWPGIASKFREEKKIFISVGWGVVLNSFGNQNLNKNAHVHICSPMIREVALSTVTWARKG